MRERDGLIAMVAGMIATGDLGGRRNAVELGFDDAGQWIEIAEYMVDEIERRGDAREAGEV